MKRLLALAVALAAVAMVAPNADAQVYSNGYQFGTGVNAGFGNCFRSFQREQPPYFAKFPPVYYSHIVKRPYGVSPYAAPAGIAPVEMSYVAPVPVTVKNPFFGKSTPAKLEAKLETKPDTKTNGKTARIVNPFVGTVAIR